jgi:Ca2+-transporting ATPase
MQQIKYPVENPTSFSLEEISKLLKTNDQKGLSQNEAEERNNELGLNSYQAQKQKHILLLLLDQFKNPIVYLLFFGSAVSFYFKDIAEGIAILAVIFINAAIGFFMEIQARSSMNALKKMDVILSKVFRDGILREISAEKLTAGDLVFVEAGDVIPADGRLIEANHLECDESALTGESLPAEKNVAILNKETPLAEQHNMVFKGTSVIKGNAKIIITGIGSNTELGKISTLVEQSQETINPLDKKLNQLTKKLIWLTLIITGIFIITGFIQGKDAYIIIETAIALAVAAIPEGLPIVATIALAYGMLLMARKNAIVKKLSSVETLGGTTIILTDKTGTLTENKIYVNTYSFPEGDAEVRVNPDKKTIEYISGNVDKSKDNLARTITIAALCNNAVIANINGEIKETGDPLEVGLIKLVEASGLTMEETKNKYPRINEYPFSSETKIMATLHKDGESYFATAKGSVEHLLNNCTLILSNSNEAPLTEALKAKIIEGSENLSAKGLRVLAFAYKSTKEANAGTFMKEMVYAGSIGFLDPPRLDVRDAILTCREAGIKIVMVTGDHPKTALNIAQKVGLVDEDDMSVMNGSEFPENEILTEELKTRILNTSVFARATPKQKLDIAELYQKRGNIVAMTGDGVNDAPALKKADVGIAMGLRGTQVAKETADIILKDDSFVSITEAVSHGRVIFQNIQKFVIFLLSCNLSEIFIVTLMAFIFPAATLLPLQILSLNMITDVFPALALGMGKGNNLIMKDKPRNPDEPIINTKQWQSLSYYAAIITLCIGAGVYCCYQYISKDPIICNNVAFLSLSLSQLWHVFNMNSSKSGLIKNEITKNPYVWGALTLCFAFITAIVSVPPIARLLDIKPLTTDIVILCTITGLLPLVIIQIIKRVMKRS